MNRLPTVLSDTLSSGSEEASSQLGQNLSPPTRTSRLSLDSRLSTAPSRVLLRRQQQPPASSSQQSGGSRWREAANPFDVARSEDGISAGVKTRFYTWHVLHNMLRPAEEKTWVHVSCGIHIV